MKPTKNYDFNKIQYPWTFTTSQRKLMRLKNEANFDQFRSNKTKD